MASLLILQHEAVVSGHERGFLRDVVLCHVQSLKMHLGPMEVFFYFVRQAWENKVRKAQEDMEAGSAGFERDLRTSSNFARQERKKTMREKAEEDMEGLLRVGGMDFLSTCKRFNFSKILLKPTLALSHFPFMLQPHKCLICM